MDCGGHRRRLPVAPVDADEGIVRGNAVVLACRGMVDIDSQDRPEHACPILSVCDGIVAVAAVTEGDVQVAVWSELNRTPVVILVGLIDFHQDKFGLRIGLIRIVLGDRETRDHRLLFGGVRIVHVEVAVGLEVGMHRQSEQALFVSSRLLPVVDLATKVENQMRIGDIRSVLKRPDRAVL